MPIREENRYASSHALPRTRPSRSPAPRHAQTVTGVASSNACRAATQALSAATLCRTSRKVVAAVRPPRVAISTEEWFTAGEGEKQRHRAGTPANASRNRPERRGSAAPQASRTSLYPRCAKRRTRIPEIFKRSSLLNRRRTSAARKRMERIYCALFACFAASAPRMIISPQVPPSSTEEE